MYNANECIVEIFKPILIDNEKTHYLISDYGRCYNTKRNEYVDGTVRHNGRRIFTISHKGVKYRKTVARWMALAFLELPYGDNPDIFHADHIDENIKNDVLSNIQWLTPEENIKKHYSTRLNEHIGEQNKFSILDEEVVRKIFHDALEYDLTPVEISRKYNINRFTVQKILSGINWTHIYREYDMSNYNPGRGKKSSITKDTRNRIILLYRKGISIKNIIIILSVEGIIISDSYIRKIIKESKL